MITVTFTIDVDASTDAEAVQMAIDLMQRPGPCPLEFLVSDDPDDNRRARLVTVTA